MAAVSDFKSEVFENSIRGLLQRLPEERIPRALNKKMFFTTLRALDETPKTNPFKILFELKTPVLLKREDGSTDTAPVGYALAAQRASKAWGARRTRLSERKRKANLLREWQKLITKKFDAMVGARRRSIAFIKSGWVGVLQSLGPFVRSRDGKSYDRRSTNERGSMKGNSQAAQPGWSPRVTIENTASAKSDKQNGLMKFGGPPFQRAFDKEMADWKPYLEKEVLEEETKRFNAEQKE